MTGNDEIEDLLDRWEEARDRGELIAPEDLCRGRPELLGEVARLVAELLAVDAFLDDRDETLPHDANPVPTSHAEISERYRDERFLAEGGLGRVTVARDAELPREVALKRLHDWIADSPDARRQFIREAEITARLEHPGVVPVYGFCRDRQGQPYYAMRLIQGETMARAIERFHAGDTPRRDPVERQLALQGLLRAFLAACQTVAYAHSRGVIHRDLKPSNLMLGPYGEALVVDWGLAKPIDGIEGEDAEPWPGRQVAFAATMIGTVKGSPAYMSPEQAFGRVGQIGPVSDVYSLGATLYTVLTGARPFSGKTGDEVLEAVRQGRFLPPRRVKPAIPRALEAVCLKAMSFDPTDRYPSAADLAREIERWLSGEAVLAWREPWYDRLRRWARRHRVIVGSAAAAMIMGLAVQAATNGILRDLARRLEASNVSLRAALGEAERNLYARDIDLADRAWWEGEPARAAELLDECPTDRRGWEWRYLIRRNRVGLSSARLAGPIEAIGIGSGDRVVSIAAADAASYGLAGSIQVAAVSPDAKRVALVTAEAAGEVVVADSSTRAILARFTPGAPGLVESLAFSSDGRSIALAVVRRERLSARSQEKLSFLTEFEARLVLHPLDTGPEQVSNPFEKSGRPGTPVAPGDGRCYCPVIFDESVSLQWKRADSPAVEQVGSDPRMIALSPDGSRYVGRGEGDALMVREVAGGRAIANLLGQAGPVRSLCFSPDGTRVAAASEDRTIRVWELGQDTPRTVLRGQASPADRLVFSADGTRLVSASALDRVVWDPAAIPEATVLRFPGRAHLAGLAIASTGRVAVVARHQLTWRDATTGRAASVGATVADVDAVASAPRGGWVAVGTGDGPIVLIDAEGRVARTLEGHKTAIQGLSFASDGLRLASASRDGEVRTWDVATGRELARVLAGPIVGCSPDGGSIASGGIGDVVIFDAISGVVRQRLAGSGTVQRLAYRPDGSLIAVIRSAVQGGPSRDELTVLETATGRVRYVGGDQPSGVTDAVFSPDGERLASSDLAGEVVIRETSSGRPLVTLRGPTDAVLRLAFTPDGNRLLAAGGRVDPLGVRSEEAEELAIWDARPPD